MDCPFCGHDDTHVKDSRLSHERDAVRRRRYCPACHERFTTFERMVTHMPEILKKNGQVRPFDREKLYRSLSTAVRKRNIPESAVNHMVETISRSLQAFGDGPVPTPHIGELAMEALARLDQVAYIRFASVYKAFDQVEDFQQLIQSLCKTPPPLKRCPKHLQHTEG